MGTSVPETGNMGDPVGPEENRKLMVQNALGKSPQAMQGHRQGILTTQMAVPNAL